MFDINTNTLTTEEIYNLIIAIDTHFKQTSAIELKLTGLYLNSFVSTLFDIFGYTTNYDSNNSFFISKHRELI